MDPRSLCLVGMLGLPAIAVFNQIYFGAELKNFVATTPRLESTHDLERFKAVVAHQMYAALAQFVFLAAPPMIYFIGLFKGVLSAPDIVYVIVPSVLILVVAAMYRGGEKRAKTIPTDDSELEKQRDAIVRTWLGKPWPDW